MQDIYELIDGFSLDEEHPLFGELKNIKKIIKDKIQSLKMKYPEPTTILLKKVVSAILEQIEKEGSILETVDQITARLDNDISMIFNIINNEVKKYPIAPPNYRSNQFKPIIQRDSDKLFKLFVAGLGCFAIGLAISGIAGFLPILAPVLGPLGVIITLIGMIMMAIPLFILALVIIKPVVTSIINVISAMISSLSEMIQKINLNHGLMNVAMNFDASRLNNTMDEKTNKSKLEHTQDPLILHGEIQTHLGTNDSPGLKRLAVANDMLGALLTRQWYCAVESMEAYKITIPVKKENVIDYKQNRQYNALDSSRTIMECKGSPHRALHDLYEVIQKIKKSNADLMEPLNRMEGILRKIKIPNEAGTELNQVNGNAGLLSEIRSLLTNMPDSLSTALSTVENSILAQDMPDKESSYQSKLIEYIVKQASALNIPIPLSEEGESFVISFGQS